MGWRADTCAQNVVLIAADNVGMDAADALVMQDVETGGQLRLLAAEGHLQLHGVVLQVGQAALQQHLALVHDTHVVADVLQLAEVVAGHQNGGATLGHVCQQQRPHLTAHDGVKAVHGSSGSGIPHAAHGDPEGRRFCMPLLIRRIIWRSSSGNTSCILS